MSGLMVPLSERPVICHVTPVIKRQAFRVHPIQMIAGICSPPNAEHHGMSTENKSLLEFKMNDSEVTWS